MKMTSRLAGILVIAASAAGLVPRAGRAHGSITTTVLFDREIVGLLERRCVSCHNQGGLAFPLSTYEQTWIKRLSMRTEVLRRHMPPWAAVPGYGEFANDNGLTPRETQFLISWVEGLGPRNAGTSFLNVPGAPVAAPVRASEGAAGWQLGEPDIARAVESVTVPASSSLVVRRATIDLRLTEPQRIGAIEFLPGDRRRLRAASFRVESTGQWLGGWTPWYGFAKLPADVAFQLPAGTRIAAEFHFAAGVEPVTDVGMVGLFRAPGAAVAPADLVVAARSVPGRPHLRRGSVRLAADATIWALAPDIPPGTESLEVSARRRDGSTQVLLLVERPFADWPTPYVFKAPVRLRRGSELQFVLATDVKGSAPRLTISRYTGPPQGP
jgi:hypothetical protein